MCVCTRLNASLISCGAKKRKIIHTASHIPLPTSPPDAMLSSHVKVDVRCDVNAALPITSRLTGFGFPLAPQQDVGRSIVNR